jgi:cytochrome P450
MTLATELELPLINTLDEALRGDAYREVMFPSMTLAALFNVTEGPLYEEISKNLITRHGADHSRLRGLVNAALTPRRADTYRPAIGAILSELMEELADTDRLEFVSQFAKPYTSRVIAQVLGAPRDDAPKLHYWSNLIQRQFDPASLMNAAVLAEIERGVIDCYAYIDALIETRRAAPADNLVTDLIGAEEAGDKLNHDELRNLIFSILLGGVDTTQSQLGHAIRLLSQHPEQWHRRARGPAPAHLRRRHPLLRRRQPRPRRAPGSPDPPRRDPADDRAGRRAGVRHPVRDLRPRRPAAPLRALAAADAGRPAPSRAHPRQAGAARRDRRPRAPAAPAPHRIGQAGHC